MPQKPRVRTLIDSQHVKGSERVLKSAQQYFCHIFDHSEKIPAEKNLV